MQEFKIREGGKNGTLALQGGLLHRTIAKRVGRNDHQTFAVKALTSVHHNRKLVGTNVVTVQIGVQSFDWKVAKADELIDTLNWCIANGMTPDQWEG